MNFLQASQFLTPFASTAQPAAPPMETTLASMDTATATISAPVSCSLIQDTYAGTSGASSGNVGCSCMTSNNLLDWGLGGGDSEGVVV